MTAKLDSRNGDEGDHVAEWRFPERRIDQHRAAKKTGRHGQV